MPARFVNIDPDTPLLLPPNLRDWVPANHLCLFIVDAVEELDLRQVKVNERGTGSEQYPPRLLLSLLLYSYATGVFGSRRIEQSSYDSVPVRVLCADTHPDQKVEPVFGIIKSVIGFRRFLLRRLEKVSLEWTWVSVAYNLKRLHRMATAG